MNRNERRLLKKEQHKFVAKLPDVLTLIPPEEMPVAKPAPAKAWLSRKYLVQAYAEGVTGTCVRLSICRSSINVAGGYEDRLAWDELQTIKREVGFGDWYGIEIYPRDDDMVNVANFRHLWLFAEPLPIGWFRKAGD